jgi:3-dehydroquinate synthase/shikimate kinase/3-dehydroquinate synthase
MKQIKLQIKSVSKNYPIIIGPNLISNFDIISQKYNLKFERYLLVVDKNVPKKKVSAINRLIHTKKKIIHYYFASERNKNQRSVNIILDILLNNNFSRSDCLISIGGGITGDISAFAASQFKRGINFINIPTTLLSQVDSSIGGKTGINTKQGKNLIGSFYQPRLVISDTNFLKTLPKREIICGYAEILKHSLISNKDLYKYLKKNIDKILNLESPFIEKSIFESCKIKKRIVEKDEMETGLRKTLNFGHTFAHAYEATLNYSKKLNHGEAVILGMNTALKFSMKKNFLDKSNYVSILNHLNNPNLPSRLSNYFLSKDIKKILSYMSNDKKNNSNMINLILLKKIGSVIINKQFSKSSLRLFLKKELSD